MAGALDTARGRAFLELSAVTCCFRRVRRGRGSSNAEHQAHDQFTVHPSLKALAHLFVPADRPPGCIFHCGKVTA